MASSAASLTLMGVCNMLGLASFKEARPAYVFDMGSGKAAQGLRGLCFR